MKKLFHVLLILIVCISNSGFTFFSDEKDSNFNIEDLYDYEKVFAYEEIELCSSNATKSYMDYRATTVVSSRQYQFMHNHCTVDKTGFLLDEDNFIAVALGSYFGEIGERYYFTLDSGVVLPVVKAEEKADVDTDARGCYHTIDSSVIEFVIDRNQAKEYFGEASNGLVLQGNYNNYPLFSGNLVKVEKVLDEKNKDTVQYQNTEVYVKENNKFNQTSGY